MKVKRLLLLAFLLLTGCGSSGPLRIDATTQQSYDDSLFAVSEQLSGEDKRKFEAAVPLVAGRFPPNIKQLHGMTAGEVIDEGVSVYMVHVANGELMLAVNPTDESSVATMEKMRKHPLFTPGRKMEPDEKTKSFVNGIRQAIGN